MEEEILVAEEEDLVRSVFSELERRFNLLGEDYPFTYERLGAMGSGARLQWREDAADGEGRVAYAFCLIISSLRWCLLQLDELDLSKETEEGIRLFTEHRYGLLLQTCASLALGGYLRGDVVSFGYPRPDGTSFLAAHKAAWVRFGAYETSEIVPVGMANAENDAGIDLIGWLSFPDGHASKILVFGQVASGRNWAGKTAVDCAKRLKGWFNGSVYEWFIPAIVMPFNIADARVSIRRGPNLRARTLEAEERPFGIVLDRDRVAACVANAFRLDDLALARIDGAAQFSAVNEWVSNIIADLSGVA